MSRRPDVVVFDYGSGNVHSAVKALEAAGAEVELTSDRQRAIEADGLLVPGVGSFDAVMQALRAAGGPAIIDQRLAGGRAVLGICVGMQVLFSRGIEGSEPAADDAAPMTHPDTETQRIAHAKNADEFWWEEPATPTDAGTEGLDQWNGEVIRLNAPLLPHMGWNTVAAAEGSMLFEGIEQERFYFVHSYAARDIEIDEMLPYVEPMKKTYAHYGERFLAAAENGPLCATQFHPEKSGAAGIALLRNWVNSLG